MKAITLKAPLVWAIFNANLSTIRHKEYLDPGTQLAVHAGKSCSVVDVEKFSKRLGISIPPRERLFLGQVVGVVSIVECCPFSGNMAREWVLAKPKPIRRFYWRGQAWVYDIPDERIDFDTSKNPVAEESGYKFSGAPKGEWRVTVWPHPSEENFYSYAVAIAGGFLGNGILGHTTLHGCYPDAEEALQAGIEQGVYGR
ncbi:hypothetical protein [Dendronalium sp. ChiSLP03b]|uniref:hypothetical protein n=1 Tax=Dendronalium sp. ChiSLP03b TaxID=3075381 RepID=UPI00391995B2